MAVKILVVEDEVLVGMDLVMLLEDWGYAVDGPIGRVQDALDAIEAFEPDIAILDMNLGDGATSLPVADALTRRETPFVFLTGYSRVDAAGNSLAQRAPRLTKPFAEEELRELLQKVLDGDVSFADG